MNYLLDRYIFAFLPFNISDEWKQHIGNYGMNAIRAADWFCKTQDIGKFYSQHATFLAAEILYLLLSTLTLIHAYRHGGRYVYTWIATLIYGLILGNLNLLHPIFDNQWYAQGLLTFSGGRIPLSAIFSANHFLYIAYIFVQRMYLPFWEQGIATGIAVLLVNLPFNIVGTKLLWWSWPVNDPTYSDTFYGVPWIKLTFDFATASAFVCLLHLTRKFLLDDFYDWKKFVKEFVCAFIAPIFAVLFGILESQLLYAFTSIVSVPFVVSMYLAFNCLAVYISDRHNKDVQARYGAGYWFDELSLAVCTNFLFIAFLMVASNTSNIVSEGMHQPIGPCSVKMEYHFPGGFFYEKAKYLCLKNFNKRNMDFDFHCLPGDKPAMLGEETLDWYPICGAILNSKQRMEIIAVVCSICIFALALLYQAAAKSGKTPRVYRVIYQSFKSR